MSILKLYVIGLITILFFSLSPVRSILQAKLGFVIFALCQTVSCIAGVIGGVMLAEALFKDQHPVVAGPYLPQCLLAIPFTMPIVAVLTFLFLYLGIALPLVRNEAFGNKDSLFLPRLKIGILCAAVSPFIAMVIGFVLKW